MNPTEKCENFHLELFIYEYVCKHVNLEPTLVVLNTLE